jgi:hypothetical protein
MRVDEFDNPRALPVNNTQITEDFPCSRCNYNLRGLKTGDRCPECGARIRRTTAAWQSAHVEQIPAATLKFLRLGASSCLIAALGMFGGPILTLYLLNNQMPAEPGMLAIIGSAAAWLFGCICINVGIPTGAPRRNSPEIAVQGKHKHAAWRTANRSLAACQLGAALAGGALFDIANGGQTFLGWTSLLFISVVILQIAAFIGFGSQCYYMALLCDLAEDEETATRFRSAPFLSIVGFPLLAGFIVLCDEAFSGAVSLRVSVMGLGAVGILALGCMQGVIRAYISFRTLMSWAAADAENADDRNQRISDRIVSRIRENTSQSDE